MYVTLWEVEKPTCVILVKHQHQTSTLEQLEPKVVGLHRLLPSFGRVESFWLSMLQNSAPNIGTTRGFFLFQSSVSSFGALKGFFFLRSKVLHRKGKNFLVFQTLALNYGRLKVICFPHSKP